MILDCIFSSSIIIIIFWPLPDHVFSPSVNLFSFCWMLGVRRICKFFSLEIILPLISLRWVHSFLISFEGLVFLRRIFIAFVTTFLASHTTSLVKFLSGLFRFAPACWDAMVFEEESHHNHFLLVDCSSLLAGLHVFFPAPTTYCSHGG